jgi:hypothetical protein
VQKVPSLARTILTTLGLAVLTASTHASAQSERPGEPDTSKARVRVGRVMLNPTLILTNLGVDTNVFNEPDQSAPKSDFTMTVTPQSDLWLRMGRSWLTGNIKEDLVWYKTYASERSANHTVKAGWLLPLNRLTFNADTTYLRTHERPGFEIDTRSERSELTVHSSLEIRARPKIFVGIRADQAVISYDSAETFDGFNLRDQLNRTTTTTALTARHQITPLTALTLDVGREQQRFALSPLRDADSTTAAIGIKLDRFALVKGTASIGYQSFQPVSPSLPAYRGPIASAGLSYVAFGTTRLTLDATREVQPSFDIDQPYYLRTGASISLARQLVRRVDVIGRLGVQKLAYRDRVGVINLARDRLDNVNTFGGGVGYHLANGMRIGFNIDQQHRSSPLANREYHGLTFGTSVTYGL